MKRIDQFEKQLPDKRKALLFALRKHNWEVVGVDHSNSDWALEEKWLIESTRESKGIGLILWMFKYDGIHDGLNRVVATLHDTPEPGAYGSSPSIEFDTPRFEKQLKSFLAAIHEYRINGNLTDSNDEI